MYINQAFMDSCSPIELQFMRTCIDKLIYDKVTTETTNYDNLKDTVCECPHCHSKNYKKNGFNPKYILFAFPSEVPDLGGVHGMRA